MYIERLELVGYKRLMLSNIHRFVLTPESVYQIILGTNGSGKTSILYELSPLPAQSQDYVKDGYKIINIRHNQHQYVCSSIFKGVNKHSFLKDGEELNPGGTGQIQKDLVRKEFGITAELREVLIGQNRFTEMSPLQRREQITALSNVDYGYAIGVFNKLKTQWRDRLGALRLLRERLSSATNEIRSLDFDQGIYDRENQIHSEVSTLLSERSPNIPTTAETNHHTTELLATISTTSKDCLRLIKALRQEERQFSSMEQIDLLLASTGEEIAVLSSIIDRNTKEFDDLKSVSISLGCDLSGEIPENLDALIAANAKLQQDIIDDIQMFHGLEQPASIKVEADRVLPDVIELFKSLPDNTSRYLSRESEANTRAKNKELSYQRDELDTKMRLTYQRIKEIENARDNTCPKCRYVWREGFSEGELQRLKDDLAAAEVVKAVIDVELKKLEVFLEELGTYSDNCRRFRLIAQSYTRLRPLWDYIIENKLLTNNPQSNIGVFTQFLSDLRKACHLEEVVTERKHLDALFAQRQYLETHANPITRLQQLEEEIGTAIETRNRVKKERNRIAGLRADYGTLDEYLDEITRLESQIDILKSRAIEAIRNEEIDLAARKLHSELGHLQNQINTRKNLETIIKDISNTLSQVELDHQALTIVTKHLSPTEGFIAEQMAGFISCFTAQLNSIIAAIWSYSLTVMPCGLESGELSYKFPMQINAADNMVADVSKGSKAQREVVNFAYILTVMLYKNLQQYPLYLDELGEGFDEQHRENAMNFIKHLIDVGQYSQVYLISHYMTSWSIFQGAQHLVLDGSNIAVPDNINQHAILE